jgi:ribosome recycling factor
MTEEVNIYLDDARERMAKAIKHLEIELATLRAGKADPNILNGVYVDYYGVKSQLGQVSNINTTDARTIVIQPWEKKMIDVIEKAIMAANIGLMPVNNGEIIRLNVPPLTEERRLELVKKAKVEGENAKISIRAIRKDTNTEIKQLEKNGLSEDIAKDAEELVQKITTDFTKTIDEIIEHKEKDILTV